MRADLALATGEDIMSDARQLRRRVAMACAESQRLIAEARQIKAQTVDLIIFDAGPELRDWRSTRRRIVIGQENLP